MAQHAGELAPSALCVSCIADPHPKKKLLMVNLFLNKHMTKYIYVAKGILLLIRRLGFYVWLMSISTE